MDMILDFIVKAGIYFCIGVVVAIIHVATERESLFEMENHMELIAQMFLILIAFFLWPIYLLGVILLGSRNWFSDNVLIYCRSMWQNLRTMFYDWFEYWSAAWHEFGRGPLGK